MQATAFSLVNFKFQTQHNALTAIFQSKMLFKLLLPFLLFHICASHISWLFPEARWPHFDYTNTRDNIAPCGLAASKNGKMEIFVLE
jgi:hypothetical protein